MPVKKGKSKKNNIDSKVKKQIKDTVEKLPKLIAEEMGENKTKNLPHYDDPSYKNKKIMMWTIVAIFFLVILIMWAITINSVFYDFTRSLRNDDSLDTLNKGKEKIEETYSNDFKKLIDEIDVLFENNSNPPPEEETKKDTINLGDLINAVNNFTSTTTTTTPLEEITTSTEEIVE